MSAAEDLRAEALSRTVAAIRSAFPRMTATEVDMVTALLLRHADGRPTMTLRRTDGGTHTAVFSPLRHDAVGDAFYVSRIE